MMLIFGLATVGFIGWGIPALMKAEPVGDPIAPDPEDHNEAVVQVYGADVWGVRGRFAMHTWVATKPQGADTYTIYQVIGWRLRRKQSVVSIDEGMPNQKWFGSDPVLLLDRRGQDAGELVQKIDDAARRYPFADAYTMWPGPNSNSFVEWIGLMVPELNLQLPAKALGKNWMQSYFRKMQRLPETRGSLRRCAWSDSNCRSVPSVKG